MEVNFLKLVISWRIYISTEAILLIKQFKLIGKKEFVGTSFDLKKKIHIVYMTSFYIFDSYIQFYWQAQVSILLFVDVYTTVPDKYTKFVDIFSPNLVAQLLKHMKINNYAIKLIDN